MTSGPCAVCGANQNIVTIKICPDVKMPDFHKTDGCICICNLCKSSMAIKIEELTKSMDVSTTGRSHAQVVEMFIRTFCDEVWKGVKIPSYQTLANALNLANIHTASGHLWQYNNLMQYMIRCNIRRSTTSIFENTIVMTPEDIRNAAHASMSNIKIEEEEATKRNDRLEAGATERIDELIEAAIMPSGFPGM